MSDTAISVKNLSKYYLVGHNSVKAEPYTTFREVLASNARNLVRKTRDMFNGKAIVQGDEVEEFWALKDVSFDIKQGDRVGIIGRNGAGKSTLLKILSRITEPSSGRIKIKGRVASLLEVGTGFHPELTGRENIFLNGAILGMSRNEIKHKFDEIVAFAEVERFLDTPVKRYSSGMYMRLAFAVAAHLEPEILIVDEVLAVGDAQFQKKCLGKMQDVSSQGRTVLFVSHNMDAISRLCSRIIWLQDSHKFSESNEVEKILKNYIFGDDLKNKKSSWYKPISHKTNPYFDLQSIVLKDREGNLIDDIISRNSEVVLEISADVNEKNNLLSVGYIIYSENGDVIYWSCSTDSREDMWPIIKIGINNLQTVIPSYLLNEGNFTIEVISSLYSHQWLVQPGHGDSLVSFTISGNISESQFWSSKRPGLIAPIMNWYVI